MIAVLDDGGGCCVVDVENRTMSTVETRFGSTRVLGWARELFVSVEDVFAWGEEQAVSLRPYADPASPISQIRMRNGQVVEVDGDAAAWGNRVVPLWYPWVLLTGPAPSVLDVAIEHPITRDAQPDEPVLMAPQPTDGNVTLFKSRAYGRATLTVDTATGSVVRETSWPSGVHKAVDVGSRLFVGLYHPEYWLGVANHRDPTPRKLLNGNAGTFVDELTYQPANYQLVVSWFVHRTSSRIDVLDIATNSVLATAACDDWIGQAINVGDVVVGRAHKESGALRFVSLTPPHPTHDG